MRFANPSNKIIKSAKEAPKAAATIANRVTAM
jgi:hypothetical protein